MLGGHLTCLALRHDIPSHDRDSLSVSLCLFLVLSRSLALPAGWLACSLACESSSALSVGRSSLVLFYF